MLKEIATTFATLLILLATYGLIANYIDNAKDNLLNELEAIESEAVKHEEEIDNCIGAGYTVYFDGEEVDPSKYDLSMYKTSVNHKEKEIYVTHKKGV